MARISGIDLPRDKQLETALTYIYGIGPASAKQLVQSAGLDGTTRVRLGAVDQDNAYGTYHLNKALGHEGMAISADKKHAYFFPGDVPGGKLVRYRIVDR